MIRVLAAVCAVLGLGMRQPTRTVGAARLRSTLQGMITKHAPDRPWGARGAIVPDANGKRGLRIQGDEGYFPNGAWAWLRPLGVDPHVLDAVLSPLVTQISGTPAHTHRYTLPSPLAGPQIGDQVYAIWMDRDAQQPLVIGVVEWSHDA